jgi:hypothetical protein
MKSVGPRAGNPAQRLANLRGHSGGEPGLIHMWYTNLLIWPVDYGRSTNQRLGWGEIWGSSPPLATIKSIC